MTDILHHSPKKGDPIVEYISVENDFTSVDEVFNFLFNKVIKENSLYDIH